MASIKHVSEATNLLKEAVETKSILKALDVDDMKKEMAIKKVFDFMQNNIENECPGTSRLIAANVIYLHEHLRHFVMYYSNDDQQNRVIHSSGGSIHHRRNMEWSWITMNIHKLMMSIIYKYKDNEWINKNNGTHSICIYGAISILGDLCKAKNKRVINTIVKETAIIKTLFHILSADNHNISFIERLAALQLLQSLINADNLNKEIFVKMDCNVIKTLISICCNAFNILLLEMRDKWTIPQKMVLDEFSQQVDSKINKPETVTTRNATFLHNVMTYTRSPMATKNTCSQTLHLMAYHTRMCALQTLQYLGKKMKYSKIMDVLCSDISAHYLKRLLQVTMMTMRQGKQVPPPQVTTLDIISILAQNRFIAERLASDAEILEMLIIGMRSRTFLSEFNNREIIVILYLIVCEHDVLPKRYYSDLVFVLNDVKELRWEDISVYSQLFPCRSLSSLIHQMLSKLFAVPMLAKANADKYICSVCHNEFDFPHTLKCGHSMCYGCLIALINSSETLDDYICGNQFNPIKPNSCPLCRDAVVGDIDAFKFNQKLFEEMNENLIRIQNQQYNDIEFKGTEMEFWEYMSLQYADNIDQVFKYINKKLENNRNSLAIDIIDELLSKFDQKAVNISSSQMKKEFIEFCDFMRLKTTCYGAKKTEYINKANEIKLIGNQLFKDKNYMEAILKYKEALRLCPYLEKEFRSKCYSNISLCYQKLNDYFNSYRAAQRGLSLHRTAYQQSPKNAKLNAKLQRNMSIGLNHLLSENEMLSGCHNLIVVGSSNMLCPNRRLYDILLYQSLWEFNATQSQVLVYESGVHTVENMTKIHKTDSDLLEMKKIEDAIEHYLELNFDEFQYAHFLFKKKSKKMVYDVMTSNIYDWETWIIQ